MHEVFLYDTISKDVTKERQEYDWVSKVPLKETSMHVLGNTVIEISLFYVTGYTFSYLL